MLKLRWATGVKRTRGDTIVEVVIVTAILALVLAGSYSLTSHALNNGIDANKRTEALAIAQKQVEYIKDVYLHNAAQLSEFKPPVAPDNFCIVDPAGTPPVRDASGSSCTDYQNSRVSVSVSYADSSKVFSVQTSWEANGGNQNEVHLYYKTP